LNPDNVFVRGEELSGVPSDEKWDGSTNSDGQIASGNSWQITADNDQWVVNIVWEDPDSDSTSTLSSDSGPEA
jgi:hypothetical protein